MQKFTILNLETYEEEKLHLDALFFLAVWKIDLIFHIYLVYFKKS